MVLAHDVKERTHIGDPYIDRARKSLVTAPRASHFLLVIISTSSVETFTASMILHEKVQEQRRQSKQHGIVTGQNDEIR